MTDTLNAIPSYLDPDFRARMIETYREIVDMPFPIPCADIVHRARVQISALEYGGNLIDWDRLP